MWRERWEWVTKAFPVSVVFSHRSRSSLGFPQGQDKAELCSLQKEPKEWSSFLPVLCPWIIPCRTGSIHCPFPQQPDWGEPWELSCGSRDKLCCRKMAFQEQTGVGLLFLHPRG